MALLALLDDEPRHGFALKQAYDGLLGQRQEVRFGQVYATLARLERDGLAEGVRIEPGGGADRRVYAVTPAGVGELDAWLQAPVAPAGRPSELFTKVVLALVAGRSAVDLLEAQRAAYLVRARELMAARHEGDVIDRLARDYEIAHLEADLRWVELAGARLGDMTARVRAVLESR